MIAKTKRCHDVWELMQQRGMGIDELTRTTGVERRVIEAIVHKRYTPSPQQRQRVSEVLGVPRDQLVWGHRATVDPHVHAPI